MKSNFFRLFDKEKFTFVFKIFLILLFIVIIFNLVFTTFSRYESTGTVTANADVALFLLNEGTTSKSIYLDGLVPQTDPFVYTINVSNADDSGNIADVDLESTMSLVTTVDLPISIELYDLDDETTNLLSTPTIEKDGDVIYKVYDIDFDETYIHGVKKTDSFVLKIYYDEIYKNSSELYQGAIDLITITLSAQQLV